MTFQNKNSQKHSMKIQQTKLLALIDEAYLISDLYDSVSDTESNASLVEFAELHLKKYDDMYNDYEKFTDEDKFQLRMYLKMFASFIKLHDIKTTAHYDITLSLIQIFVDASFNSPGLFAKMISEILQHDTFTFDRFVELRDIA